MNTAAALIDAVVELDATLHVEGQKIIYEAPEALPDALLATLRSHKPELVDFMTGGRGCLVATKPPEAWVVGVAAMADMPAPLDWPAHIWPGTVDNAQRFFERWGAIAAALGWSVNDCFGVYDKAPYRRHDHMGIALSMWVDRVAVLLPTEAILWRDGSRLTYRRGPKAGDAVPVWRV